MSITDELRKWWVRKFPVMDKELHDDFTAIADHIDAEHEREIAAAALVAGVPMTDENMAEHGWIRLPVGADGLPIRVGDVMERMERRGKVIALQLSDNPWGDGNHWAIQLEGEHAPTVLDAFFHHLHPLTVEDVLFELLRRYDPDELEDATSIKDLQPEWREVVADFAKRLRLAGGEDE